MTLLRGTHGQLRRLVIVADQETQGPSLGTKNVIKINILIESQVSLSDWRLLIKEFLI